MENSRVVLKNSQGGEVRDDIRQQCGEFDRVAGMTELWSGNGERERVRG